MFLISKTWGQREAEGTKRARSSCPHSKTAGQPCAKDRGRSTGSPGMAQDPGLQRGVDTAHNCSLFLPLQGMEELEVEFLLEER